MSHSVQYTRSNISAFLQEMAENYADTGMTYQINGETRRIDGHDIMKKTRQKMIEWICNGIDVASYINKPIYENGETELMYTFRWARYLDVMCEWFKMLVEFGGNPLQNNKNGLDAYEIALSRFKEHGLEEEFSDFINEVEEIRAK
jgi:hypothetical protein